MPDEAAGQAAGPASHPLAVALGLLRASAPEEIIAAPQDWPRWAVLLPHVLAATSYLDSVADQHGPEAMANASRLLELAGIYLWVHARLADAKMLQERALAIDEATYGPDHPTLANRLNNLAAILRDPGQPEEARPLQERALAIDEVAYGPNHPNVATDLNNLAAILQDLGQLELAQLLEERVADDGGAVIEGEPVHTLLAAAAQPVHRGEAAAGAEGSADDARQAFRSREDAARACGHRLPRWSRDRDHAWAPTVTVPMVSRGVPPRNSPNRCTWPSSSRRCLAVSWPNGSTVRSSCRPERR
jgi:tetratricopeptide (TPR) repeat protein